jgi:DNA-binding transcriptional MerR regulator
MGWSTREVADLAGTTLKSVRHYHDVGLLDEPERTSNGYKQYGVRHLVRLLQIGRLTDLGFSLAQIAALGDSREHPEQALRTLDAELEATIERLQRARTELAIILRDSVPTDLPAEFADAAAELSEPDRTFVSFATTILTPSALDAYGELIRNTPRTSTDTEFQSLPRDADEATRIDLADRMAPHIQDLTMRYPGLFDANTSALGKERATRAFAVAVEELYNPAQHDVLRRISVILNTPGVSHS